MQIRRGLKLLPPETWQTQRETDSGVKLRDKNSSTFDVFGLREKARECCHAASLQLVPVTDTFVVRERARRAATGQRRRVTL